MTPESPTAQSGPSAKALLEEAMKLLRKLPRTVDRDYLEHTIRTLAITPPAGARDAVPTGWYCPHCQTGVDGREVTFFEVHEACGTYIGDATPPATQPAAPGAVESCNRACDCVGECKAGLETNTAATGLGDAIPTAYAWKTPHGGWRVSFDSADAGDFDYTDLAAQPAPVDEREGEAELSATEVVSVTRLTQITNTVLSIAPAEALQFLIAHGGTLINLFNRLSLNRDAWERIVEHCMLTEAITPNLYDIEQTIQSLIDWHVGMVKGDPDKDQFAAWLATEMPAGTVIGDPSWWADRVTRQYLVLCGQPKAQPAPVVGGDHSQLADKLSELLPHLEFSRQTHVEWRDCDQSWRDKNPSIGNSKFHDDCVKEYDQRITVIREAIGHLTLLAARPGGEGSLSQDELFTGMREVAGRIEACGASPELTHAVGLACDIGSAIGNKWNRADPYAAERVRKAITQPAQAAGGQS